MGTVVRIGEELAKDADVEFVGPVLRPHAYRLARDDEKSRLVLDALQRAGAEFVKAGSISKGLLDEISQPLISEAEYWKHQKG